MIRDWYRGPCVLNHSKTSESTRREIGCFVGGSTTVASFQKSSGKSANSDGDVAWISRSDMRRSRDRSARPRWVGLLRRGCFLVRFALTAVTLSGRNDSSIDLAAFVGPVGIHHGQRDALSHTQGDDSALTVVRENLPAPAWNSRRPAWRTRNRIRAPGGCDCSCEHPS